MSSNKRSGIGFIGELRLSLRLLGREARSGELTLILLSLILAVTVSTAIALFSQRLDLAMKANANDMLGADLRISSSSALSEAWRTTAAELSLSQARTMSFPSVVLAGNEMTLAAIKAVDDGYPLRGELLVQQDSQAQAEQQTSGPQPGEAWVEQRLLSLLNIELGADIEVGASRLKVTGVIEKESDRGGNFYTLSPRVMVHWSEVAGSPLLGPGSRVKYRLLLAGEAAALDTLRESLTLEANQSFESLGDGNQAMSRSLERAQRYLGLAAILAVVLASVAVAISARRYSERHFNVSALMRTFGLMRASVLRIFFWQLLIIGVLATAIGAMAALGLQQGLISVLASVIPEGLPAAGASAWILGLSTGIISLLGFGFPHLLPLSAISPLRVLRRDLVPVPVSGWLLYGLALVSLTFLLWLLSGDAALSVGIMIGGSLTLVLLLLLLKGLLVLAGRVLRNRELSLSTRFAWQHLSRNRTATAGQLLAFALTLMVMLVIGVLRTDLLGDWQNSLPDDAPNVFALNIQPYEQDEFVQGLSDKGIAPQTLYPMVPMRLVEINGEAVSELPVAEDRAINRDLVSSVADVLPDNNEVVAGSWEETRNNGEQVSIEEELAERLGVDLGDELTFRASGVNVTATISSLRSVDWASMTPNFYMMLSADLIAQIPSSYMTSFHLSDENSAQLTTLVRQYPGITFIDTRYLLSQVQALLQRLTLAIELILVFVLAGAMLVMLSVLMTSTRERFMQGAILRTLGATRLKIRQSQWIEFVLVGGLSSLLALIGGELLCAGLYLGLFDIPYRSLGWAWLWLPPATMIGLMIPGSWMLRRVVSVPPLQVLRE
jgi:putative ABC transport system permease protein